MRFTFLLALISVVFVFYLSWLPQPKLGLVWFIPEWLSTWADARRNDTLRTGVPFVFLGLLTGVLLTRFECKWYKWIASWLGLTTIVIIAEVGQIFLPNRSFDWLDIAWGGIGAMTGLLFIFFIGLFRNFFVNEK